MRTQCTIPVLKWCSLMRKKWWSCQWERKRMGWVRMRWELFKESLLTHEFNTRGIFFCVYSRPSSHPNIHTQTLINRQRKRMGPNAPTKLNGCVWSLVVCIIIRLFGHCNLSSDCIFVIVSECVWGHRHYYYCILYYWSKVTRARSHTSTRIRTHSHWKRKSMKNQNEPTKQHLISNSHLLVSPFAVLFCFFSLLCWM